MEKYEYQWGSVQYRVAYETYQQIMYNLIINKMPFDKAIDFLHAKVSFTDILEPRYLDSEFELDKNESKDLWTVSKYHAEQNFKNLEIIVKDAPGFGPRLNQLAQAHNYRTCICCALLKHYGFIKNDKVFSGFDT
jgi:hypothetical protein